MSALWGVPEILHWWLPGNEGYKPIIKKIRSMMDDRAVQLGSQSKSEDLRNIKSIFANMKLEDKS